MGLNCEIHKKVFIYVYLQFKSELKESYLALTSLKIPLIQLIDVISIHSQTPPDKQGYSLHQLQTDKALGTEKGGVLFKRTEGLRKVYQKRRCDIKDGYLFISHSTSSKPPAKLNLLTCQVKPSLEENSKKYFDLVASKCGVQT